MTDVADFFADVTASTFDDVTTVADQIFFDDVTANHPRNVSQEGTCQIGPYVGKGGDGGGYP